MERKKIKLLAYSDFLCHTGFGHVAHYLYSGLHQTGKFDISVVGINYLGNKKNTYPFYVYPTDSSDRLGYQRIIDAINAEGVKNIDILFLFQDIWNTKNILTMKLVNRLRLIDYLKQKNPNLKIVLYFPLDGSPLNKEWINIIKEVDLCITYTNWAAKQVNAIYRQAGMDKKCMVLNHAVDQSIFYPLPARKIKFYRNKRGWSKKFVVFTINRYQPRKNFASMLRAFHLFAVGYKKCACGNYYRASLEKCDLNGCGPEMVTGVQAPKADVMFYIHSEWENYAMGGGNNAFPENNLIHALHSAGFTMDEIRYYVELLPPDAYNLGKVTSQQLNEIYNGGNVFVTTTFGEGWGLTVHEALATGTPVIVPNNSSMPEVVGQYGHLCRNAGFTFLPSDNSYNRPLVYVPDVVDALEREYQKWIKNKKVKLINYKAVEYANRQSWDDVVDQLFQFLSGIVNREADMKSDKSSNEKLKKEKRKP